MKITEMKSNSKIEHTLVARLMYYMGIVKSMNVLTMPISGGSFPHQLSILRLLMRKGYKPDLILGSSGGNITAYLAMASKWDPDGLSRVVRSLDSRFFVKSWLPSFANFVPSWVAGLFNGAIFKSTEDSYLLFDAYFTPKDICDIEIWIGAVNNQTGELALFCNRSREDAIIKGEHFQKTLTDSEGLIYMNGDVHKICKASIASSSIPVIVQYQEIDGKRYIDGGIKYASPLTPLQGELNSLSETNKGIHIVYISGYNMDLGVKQQTVKTNIVTSGLDATDHVTKGLVIHDRLTAYGMISRFGEVNYTTVENDDLDRVWYLRGKAKASILELYPSSREIIDFTDFRGEDVINMMDRSEKGVIAKVWWVGSPYLFTSICPDHSEFSD